MSFRPLHRDTWPVLVVLVLSLCLTAIATMAVSQNLRAQNEIQFNNTVDSMRRSLQRRIATYTDTLIAARGLFAVNNEVTRLDWQRYVANLDLGHRYPGIQGIGYAWRTSAFQAEDLESELHLQGFPSFKVHPRPTGLEHYPIAFLEPLDARNRAALGFDMFSEPVRHAAMATARDTGLPATTERVQLVQEITQKKQAGFLIYVPVYQNGRPTDTEAARRQAIRGFVYAPFRAGDLFDTLYAQLTHGEVNFAIYDGDVEDRNLLYDNQTDSSDGPNRFRRTVPVMVPGRTWTVVISTPRSYPAVGQTLLPLSVLFAGLAISLLLTTNAWFLVNGRRRALSLAEGMTSELRQADRAKDEFLSVISHELRTPLNFIMGFGSVLEDEVAGPLNTRQHDFLQRIMRGADRMLHLVNDLLDVAQLQTGKLELSRAPMTYGPVVQEVVTSLDQMASQKGVTLDTEVAAPLLLEADEQRVEQVLMNLVSNAIKFTPEGGRITIRAFPRDGRVVTEVVDTGIGIDTADQPKLFTRFKQLDMSATRNAGGTGLGLAISKALVEAHGGQIGVKSAPGAGSTFWFTLPQR